jgi:MFS superfamily sulfate permease-like transporter
VLRTDFWIAIAALFAVLTAGVLAGVVIGVFLSLGYVIYLSASPDMPVLGRRQGSEAFRSLADEPNAITYPSVLVMRIDVSLYFANSEAPEDRLRELALTAEPPLHAIVISFEGINFVDSQASEAIGKIIDVAHSHDIEIGVSRLKARVRRVLERDGIVDRLGTDRIYATTYEAVSDLTPAGDDAT